MPPGTRILHPAHPRSRGEHLGGDLNQEGDGGSSPLARGTWDKPNKTSICPRLIPARAGNIPGHPSATAATPAHPRSRGEHTSERTSTSTVSGSSPLARGTYIVRVCAVFVQRLIPARAGNISLRGASQTPSSAHPRSRGEHQPYLYQIGQYLGSSPLARGTYSERTVTA